MSKLERRLNNHMIVCGYGHTGRIAARALVDKGKSPEEIVVIDTANQCVQEAAEAGYVALRGDASKEDILRRAGLEKAEAVILAPGRDDTNVLIVLTVRHLNPTVKIITSVKEEENQKLLKQAGADVIVSPATVGGYMLADAVERSYTVAYLYDLMTASGRISLIERKVRPDEVGKFGREVHDGIIVRLHRGKETIGLWDLDKTSRQISDTLLLIVRGKDAPKN